MRVLRAWVCLVAPGLLLGALAGIPSGWAAGGSALDHAEINVNDRASLQRGAKWFANYCAGCHSVQYMRYSRLAKDLQLSEDQVLENFAYRSDVKIGDTMGVAMDPADAEAWFGKVPPDLSVKARARGADWLYTFLRSYYRDDGGKWNNTVLANPAMPNPFWRLQGIQSPVYTTETHAGEEVQVIDKLEVIEAGAMSPEAFDDMVRDITAYMVYLAEPAQLQRKKIGIWVLAFLAVFWFLATRLKKEFWRDVH